jgi:hypothetical protein
MISSEGNQIHSGFGRYEPVEKGSFTGCSKMARCKAPEILSREAYCLVR